MPARTRPKRPSDGACRGNCALQLAEGAWAQLTPRDVSSLLSRLSIDWWIAGGWALDVEGRRPHKDVDVAVLRPDHKVLREHLADWDLWIAHGGALRPWTSGTVGPPENAVWARPTPGDEWHIDFKIEAVEGGDWVYRRDPAVRRPVAETGVAVDGIPYLAPDLAGLYVRGS
jgi:hypothetical protein